MFTFELLTVSGTEKFNEHFFHHQNGCIVSETWNERSLSFDVDKNLIKLLSSLDEKFSLLFEKVYRAKEVGCFRLVPLRNCFEYINKLRTTFSWKNVAKTIFVTTECFQVNRERVLFLIFLFGWNCVSVYFASAKTEKILPKFWKNACPSTCP